MATSFKLNGRDARVDADPDTPLLWVIREDLGLTGTKFGCGIGACGACTVHVDGVATRSCITPVDSVDGAEITTIEGLGGDHPLQAAWVKHQVPQCGYCQSGMIMAIAGLLKDVPQPSAQDLRDSISNICRCGTYPRILKAVADATGQGVEADHG